MSDLNPTQRQEALDTIDDAMRVLGGMGRQGLNVRLQRLRKALSNPTSSVSTEGVADEPHVALCGSKDTPHWHLFGADFDSVEQFDTEAEANAALGRLTAINPDSPVEPDRG